MRALFLGSNIGKALMGVFAGAAAALAIFVAGRKAADKDQEIQELNEFIETKKRIDHVEVSNTTDAALERLHSSGQLRD